MEKSVVLRRYELIIIVDFRLNGPTKEAILKEVLDIVTKSNGKIINNQVWLEKQKMIFPIQKCNEGTYYLINLEADGPAVNAIRNHLRLNEKLLRFSILEAQPAVASQKPAVAKV